MEIHPEQRGMPRPTVVLELEKYPEVWQNRRYPVPYTAGPTLHEASDERAKECQDERRCFVCGEIVEHPWCLLKPGRGLNHLEAGPFHEVCAKITVKMCPHVSINGYTVRECTWDEFVMKWP